MRFLRHPGGRFWAGQSRERLCGEREPRNVHRAPLGLWLKTRLCRHREIPPYKRGQEQSWGGAVRGECELRGDSRTGPAGRWLCSEQPGGRPHEHPDMSVEGHTVEMGQRIPRVRAALLTPGTAYSKPKGSEGAPSRLASCRKRTEQSRDKR